MGQKINPISLRLGINKEWSSKWLAKGFKFAHKLEEDFIIRRIINEQMSKAVIDKITIEKTGNLYKITVHVARPGLIIGKGGRGIDDLIKLLTIKLNKVRKLHGAKDKVVVKMDVEEVKRYEISSQVIAQQIAWDLERRMPYRRIMKKYLQRMVQTRGIYGAKLRVSGRLNGAEIARAEQLSEGKMPLHTLRADIDYGQATAYTTYGTIGVKVWVYKGEKFQDNKLKEKNK